MDDPRAIGRRAALQALTFGATSFAAGTAAAEPAPARRSHALKLGCAVEASLLETDAAYRRTIVANYDLVVTEDALKWDRLRPSRATFDFIDGDSVVGFAKAAGLDVRGHALVFHSQVPAWLSDLRTRADAEHEMRRHISTVVGHYRGAIGSWDVVNEFTADAPTYGSGLRDTIWHRLIGDDYIEIALRTAAEADPGAQLVLTDYFLEFKGRHYDARREVMLRKARALLDKGVPLHGVGMQGHLYPDRIVDRAAVSAFVAKIRGMGLAVLVTELDVIDQSLPADLRQRDGLAAQQAFELLDAVTEGGGAHSVLTWGLRDCDSWTRWHRRRQDGLPTRALAFDDDMQPKPMFYVLEHFRRRVA